MTCPHENFVAKVDVSRLLAQEGDTDVAGYSADVRVRCADCDEPMVFRGLPIGLDQRAPTISVDGQELRVPCRPASADPNTGMGLPGFVARIREGTPGANN